LYAIIYLGLGFYGSYLPFFFAVVSFVFAFISRKQGLKEEKKKKLEK